MHITRPIATLSLVAASALVLAGCSSAGEEAAEAADAPTAAEAETVEFSWDRNIAGEDEEPELEKTTVEVPKNPEKIVAFEMSTVDTIGALGGEVAGAPLDSVPDYLQDALADDAFNAGTLFEADLIEIEAQQPDLIIIGGRSSGLYEDLSEIAPTIDLGMVGTYTESLERNVTFLGEVLGAEDEAQTALADLEAGIDEAKAVTAEAGTGLGVMVSGGELSALAPSEQGGGSANVRGGLLYDVFGVEPVVDDIASATHGEPVSFEFLLEQNPDTLWVVDRDVATGEAEAGAAAQVLDNDIVKQTSAAQNDRIVYLDPVAWYIVYGGIETTQLLIDDVMQIAS
ncbi:siderophore ABC transporter substrate-binding protein [Microbacterium oryzae]|uniref:siderophore ABC transporter substrate-binding protein n=1 Tax=Microbacterium oryzae TaxID=743009 RepID=UPI0025AFDC79|nr:siderophore ABC transporter substrate-binding protein [Microbacterium oryzae]MDN3311241.1 siderophore ABC transporter substrate-binding protein [Microbacterium oryzae]